MAQPNELLALHASAHQPTELLALHASAHQPTELLALHASAHRDLQVWVDQDLCTGDGLCVQYAPEVFEFDVDGLAYVKDGSGDLQLAKDAQVSVPSHLRLEVLDAAKECPGECIHVRRPDGPAEPLDEDERDAIRASLGANA